MRRKPSQHFKRWTPDELATLERLISEGTPTRLIAKELGRTQAAVELRAHQEKVSRRDPPGSDAP